MEPETPAPTDPAASPVAPVEDGKTPPEADPKVPETPVEGEPSSEEKPVDGAVADPNEKDPAVGEEKPVDPKAPTEGEETENLTPDLKSMSRAERVEYFSNLDASTRKEVEAKVNEVYQPTPVDELKQKYLDEGHSEFEASMLAREEWRDQEMDIAKARAERAELNAQLTTDSIEILATVDWLNPDTKSYDKASSDLAVGLYEDLCLTRDDNTAQRDGDGKVIPGSAQIIGASMTPKQFFGLIDKIRSSGLDGAKLSAQKAAEEQMASVAAPSSNSNKKDPAFDSLSNAEKRAKLRAEGHLIT